MREYKYYGTATFIHPNDEFIRKYGENNHHQYRVVCKAKSFAEAVRIAESLGLYRTFSKKYTSPTENVKEIEACDKYDFVICTSGLHGDHYIDIKEALINK